MPNVCVYILSCEWTYVTGEKQKTSFQSINFNAVGMLDVYEEGMSRSQDKGEDGEDEGENRRRGGEEGGNTVFLPISFTHTCSLIKQKLIA